MSATPEEQVAGPDPRSPGEPTPDSLKPKEPPVPTSAQGKDKGQDDVGVDLSKPWETKDIDGKERKRPPEPKQKAGVKVFVLPTRPSKEGDLRLGRHVEHDEKSREHRAIDLVPAQAEQRNRLWTHRGKILDQGPLAASTGFAAACCLMTTPHWVKGRNLTEEDALAIYTKATTLDQVSGDYPTTDTGSTAAGLCKALVALGYIESYRWSFGWDEAQMVLSTVGPLLAGTPWYEGFDRPDKDGVVHLSGESRGGQEYVLVGIDYDTRLVRAAQSWGPLWGDKGFFSITFEDMRRLLQEQGDLALPVPLVGDGPSPVTPPAKPDAPTPPAPPVKPPVKPKASKRAS